MTPKSPQELADEHALNYESAHEFAIAETSFLVGHRAAMESAEVKGLVEKAEVVLEIESVKNLKKARVVDGQTYYAIGGNFAKNAAYRELDIAIQAFRDRGVGK